MIPDMRSLISILEERNAYLYHGTQLENAVKIVRDNCLYGSTEKEELPKAVSTSRSAVFAYGVGTWFDRTHPVIFVLDQRLLRQRMVLKPHADTNQDGESWQGSNTRGIEAEERVIGSISPLNRYLVSVNVDPDFIKRARKEVAWWVEDGQFADRREAIAALDALANHPKLNVLALPLGVEKLNQQHRKDLGYRNRKR